MLKVKCSRQINQNRVLAWAIDALPFWLQIEFVRLENNKIGVALNPLRTHIPDEIELTAIQSHDILELPDGRLVWLLKGHGLTIRYRGNHYPLFRIDEIDKTLETGRLSFYYLPAQFKHGDIIPVMDA
jgi:hypothetical protein